MSAASSYAIQVRDLAKQITGKATTIAEMEEARVRWTTPGNMSIWIGEHLTVVRPDGVNPALAGVQREAVAYIDSRLHKLRSEMEGLRFRLIQLGRES